MFDLKKLMQKMEKKDDQEEALRRMIQNDMNLLPETTRVAVWAPR
jgi:hypothetical protein